MSEVVEKETEERLPVRTLATRYPKYMKDRFKDLRVQGYTTRQAGHVIAEEYKGELTPPSRTYRSWNRKLIDANIVEDVPKADWIIELGDRRAAVRDDRSDIKDRMRVEIDRRYFDHQFKDVPNDRLLQLYLKILTDEEKSINTQEQMLMLHEAGLTGHQQIMINIHNRAEKRKAEENDDSDGGVIDAEFRDVSPG